MSRVLPILFDTDMVRAILEDRKTVTRRCVKPKSKNACGFYVMFRESDNAFMGVYDYDENERQFDNSQTRPYQLGDILYVRETWFKYNGEYIYRASAVQPELFKGMWRPSIHMPKEAARIWLKVTDVRVERLQDIMKDPPGPNNQVAKEGCKYGCDFIAVWEETIKKSEKDMYGWDANPWVWVIEFERCEKPVGEV